MMKDDNEAMVERAHRRSRPKEGPVPDIRVGVVPDSKAVSAPG